MPRLLVLGPNPAWQKVLHFARWEQYGVNRAVSMEEFASGKGGNFCRAVLCSGKAHPELIQAAGGETGRRIAAGFEAEKIPCVTISAGGSRCCFSLCAPDGKCTEVIEPGRALTTAEEDALLDAFRIRLAEAGMAAFCGSLPDGSDPSFYLRAAELARERNVPLLLDTERNLEELLKGSSRAAVKINREELARITGEQDIFAGIRKLMEHKALMFCGITDGAGEAYAATRESVWRYTLPELEHVISPIGCGDTCGAVLASELLAGTAPEEAFAQGLAAASANCLVPVYGRFRKSDALRIRKEIKIKMTEK